MTSHATISRALAAAFLIGNLDVNLLVDRGTHLLGKRWRWLRPLAKRVVAEYSTASRPRQITVARFILADPGFQRACEKHVLCVANWQAASSTMQIPTTAASWALPRIETVEELAEWSGVSGGELAWFADRRSLESKQNAGRLRHYHYRGLTKRFGQIRLIESPKPRLKRLQRRILSEILDRIPPHDAVHGFRRGRSITTFAAPHLGRRMVLKIDLQDFFPSITVARIQAIFRTVGYSEEVADVLAGLCTNTVPEDALPNECRRFLTGQPGRTRWLYTQPHLPQGAPTSPALANLSAYRLDCRLTGLARAADAAYTRYADDLAFSGDRAFERVAGRFQHHVCATVMEERFAVHHRKTRLMWQGNCQRLAGLVVNEHLNIPRRDFDRLKATLTNCVRHGVISQNRHAHGGYRRHLEGRISFVEMVNPRRGGKLRKLFDQIVW